MQCQHFLGHTSYVCRLLSEFVFPLKYYSILFKYYLFFCEKKYIFFQTSRNANIAKNCLFNRNILLRFNFKHSKKNNL